MDASALLLSRLQFWLHHFFSHHFPGIQYWSGRLARCSGSKASANRRGRLPDSVSVLAQNIRRRFWPGRGVGRRHGLSVRYELERAVEHVGTDPGTAALV